MNSIINKLLAQPFNSSDLIFNSDAAIKKQKELRKRVPYVNIDEASFTVLGTFLQNSNLDNFTNDELKLLLSYNYNSLNANKLLAQHHKKDTSSFLYDLNNNLINAPFDLSININKDFKKLHSINKSLNVEYLINYLVSQL